MERSQEREHRKAYRFECDVAECPGYAQNDWDKFKRHMLSAHKIEPKRELYEGDVSVTKPLTAPLGESVPSSIAVAAGQAMAQGFHEAQPEVSQGTPAPFAAQAPKKKRGRPRKVRT